MAFYPTKQQQIALLYFVAGFLSLVVLDTAVSLVMPKPAILAPYPQLTKTLLQHDVSLQQWSQAAERLEEKRKLARL